MEDFWLAIVWALGLEAERLTLWHMALRAVVVYVAALIMVRLGEKRFFGKNSAFDIILGIVFGSVVSRAINGTAEFFPTLGAGLALIGLHWLFAFVAFRHSRFGTLIKGSPRTLVEDGKILWDALRASDLSEDDLRSALRLQANLENLEEIRQARLERSGNISVIKKASEPKVVDIQVTEGVQTVRIKLE